MICARCAGPVREDLTFALNVQPYGVIRHRYVCTVGHSTYDPPPDLTLEPAARVQCLTHKLIRPCPMCASIWRKRLPLPDNQVLCPSCEEPFRKYYRAQKYCSKACSNEARAHR